MCWQFIWGGRNDTTYFEDGWAFSLSNHSWTELRADPAVHQPRARDHLGAFYHEGSVWIYGEGLAQYQSINQSINQSITHFQHAGCAQFQSLSNPLRNWVTRSGLFCRIRGVDLGCGAATGLHAPAEQWMMGVAQQGR